MRRSRGRQVPRSQNPMLRITEEQSNLSTLSSLYAEYNAFANTKATRPTVPPSTWQVSKKPVPKPYVPMLRDVYPRNEYTMMPAHPGAPSYYDGKFLKEEFSSPRDKQTDDRPMYFKPKHIGNVQTKKKYGEEIKGKSSVSLHLCNDTNSDLFQRSLHNDYPREELTNDYRDPRASPLSSDSSLVFDVKDRDVPLDDRRLRSGKVVVDIDWKSEIFPKTEVVNSMKFMGAPTFRNTPRNREYDVNFNGNR